MSAVQQHQTTTSLSNLATASGSGAGCLPSTASSTNSTLTGTSAAAAASAAANLPAGTTISAVSVKQERHDEAEIQELAAKMLEAQKAAMAKQAAQQQQQQLTSAGGRVPVTQGIPPGAGGQANILNYLTRKPTNQPGVAGGGAVLSGGSSLAATPTINGQITASIVNGKSNPNSNANTNCSSSNASDDKKACDEESQKGHFGWATFGKIHIPYITRQSEKYCAVRMVEMKLLNKYLSYLHPDIYSSCTCVRSYYITDAESKLLNEINHKHCDGQFGREMFTLKDLVVRLSDANKFYQFLDICYRKLLTGSKSSSDKCGFIRINKESVVPYTVRNGEQVVPLFYFEGETENLKQKADYLSGWDLAYLKFCCKVQGIRNELFSSESVAVISLTDIKSYFPTGTEFEDYWPSKVVDSNLLIATKNPSNSSVHWTRQPSAPPPKVITSGATNVPKAVQQQVRKTTTGPYNTAVQNPNAAARMNASNIVASQSGITAAVQALTNGWSLPQAQGPLGPILAHSPSELFRVAAQAHSQQQNQRVYPPNRNQIPNMINPNRQQYNYNNGIPMASMNCQQTQQPPPLVRSQSQNQCHMSAVNVANAAAAANAVLQHQHQHQQQQHQHQHQQQQQQQHQHQQHQQHQHQQHQHQQQQRMAQNVMSNGRGQANNVSSVAAAAAVAMRLQRHQAATAAVSQQQAAMDHQSGQRLCVIPEIPAGTLHVPPYKVQKVFVFDNTMVPCINMKAYNDSDQLMTLTDFREFFFPNVPLDHCKRLIEALNVEMYKANRRQIQTLIESGKPHSENIPLIQVRDVIKYMPQLKYMMRSQEQPPNKRARIS